MIKIFHGSDRKKIDTEIKKILGENYEVFDGENLKVDDIVNIFQGGSLFSSERKILLKDLTPARGTENSGIDFYEEISKFADTKHLIVIWETNISQKKTYKDFIKKYKVEVKKFDIAPKIDPRKVFNVFDTAFLDGKKSVKMLEEIEDEQDPYMFFGLLVSQAIKKYEWKQGAKETKILKELAKIDMQMKTTAVEPWLLIKSFLLRLKTI